MKKLSPTKQEEPVMVIQKRSTSRNLVTQKIQLIKEMTGVDFSKDEKLLKIAVKMDNNEIEQLLGGIKHNDSIKPHDIKKRLIEGYIENKMKKLQNNRSIPNVNTTKTNTIGNVNKTKTTKDLE